MNKSRLVVGLLAAGFVLCLIPALWAYWLALTWNPWAVAIITAVVVAFGYGIARIAQAQRRQE